MPNPSEKPKNDADDSELTRAINGDRQDLFDELVKRYEKNLYNFEGPVKNRISDGLVKSPRSRLANPEE